MRPVTSHVAAAARTHRLPLRHKLGFAAGGLVDGTALHPLNIFAALLPDQRRRDVARAGWRRDCRGLVVDAIADPLIGSASDHCRVEAGPAASLPAFAALVPIALKSCSALFTAARAWRHRIIHLGCRAVGGAARVGIAVPAARDGARRRTQRRLSRTLER